MQGLDVDIVERQPAAALAEPRFDGREIALSHGSMHLLKRLGRNTPTAPCACQRWCP
jgi:2-polyprenyl-6-methoxyphenol hydroxylase-like FAD-dependent oxidoreductase